MAKTNFSRILVLSATLMSSVAFAESSERLDTIYRRDKSFKDIVGSNILKNKMLGSILGCAVGDALGRVPEVYWIKGQGAKAWHKDFPNGISDFNDFRKSDFENGIAIYTDDTQMAKLVFEGLVEEKEMKREEARRRFLDLMGNVQEPLGHIPFDCDESSGPCCCLAHCVHDIIGGCSQARKNESEKRHEAKKTYEKEMSEREKADETNRIMIAIAKKFAAWVDDPDGGLSWKRAPGIGSTKASRRLRDELARIENGEELEDDWWAQGEGGELKSYKEGGCGSVMHAFPFGLLYASDPDRAVELAEQHSLLTHRAPLARAACAAMAAGVAYAVRHEAPEVVLEHMVTQAKKIDEATGTMIHDAIEYAKTNPTDKQIEEYLEGLEGRLGNQAVAATAFVFACEHNDLLRAIKLGTNFYGDSDSVGSMVGALVGAYVGGQALMDEKNHDAWLAPLEDRDDLVVLADEVTGLYYS